jgi:hypothetical protein
LPVILSTNLDPSKRSLDNRNEHFGKLKPGQVQGKIFSQLNSVLTSGGHSSGVNG